MKQAAKRVQFCRVFNFERIRKDRFAGMIESISRAYGSYENKFLSAFCLLVAVRTPYFVEQKPHYFWTHPLRVRNKPLYSNELAHMFANYTQWLNT